MCMCVYVQRSIVYYTQLRVVSLSTYNFTTCLAAISVIFSPTHLLYCASPSGSSASRCGTVVDFHYFYYKCSPVLLLLLHNHMHSTFTSELTGAYIVIVNALMYCITFCRALRKMRPPTDIEHLHILVLQ